MSDAFKKFVPKEKNLLLGFLEQVEDPAATASKFRKSQVCLVAMGLVIMAIGAGHYYFDREAEFGLWMTLFLGGISIGVSFYAAQGAATTHIVSKYLNTEKIRLRLAELESEESASS